MPAKTTLKTIIKVVSIKSNLSGVTYDRSDSSNKMPTYILADNESVLSSTVTRDGSWVYLDLVISSHE